jgi:hypothetical protein
MIEIPSEEMYKLTRLAGGDATKLNPLLDAWRQGVMYARWECANVASRAIHDLPSYYPEDPLVFEGPMRGDADE